MGPDVPEEDKRVVVVEGGILCPRLGAE